MGEDEAVVLYEALGRAEWCEDLEVLTLENPAEPIVFTRLMLALRQHVPGLGTDEYSGAVRRSRELVLGGE